eukprot:1260177-Rhodomonas_salina.3
MQPLRKETARQTDRQRAVEKEKDKERERAISSRHSRFLASQTQPEVRMAAPSSKASPSKVSHKSIRSHGMSRADIGCAAPAGCLGSKGSQGETAAGPALRNQIQSTTAPYNLYQECGLLHLISQCIWLRICDGMPGTHVGYGRCSCAALCYQRGQQRRFRFV